MDAENNFVWTRQGDTLTVGINTYELIDEQTVTRFRDSMNAIPKDGVRNIVLDMGNVRMLSSMAICVLVSTDRKLKKLGGKLQLREVLPTCLEVFSYMRLQELLDIEPAMELAV